MEESGGIAGVALMAASRVKWCSCWRDNVREMVFAKHEVRLSEVAG